jgi:hypothetical protein
VLRERIADRLCALGERCVSRIAVFSAFSASLRGNSLFDYDYEYDYDRRVRLNPEFNEEKEHRNAKGRSGTACPLIQKRNGMSRGVRAA